MQDADYSETQRTGVQGRWTICPRTSRSQWDFAFKAGVTTREPGVPVVPCDDAAIERVAAALDDGRVFPGDESEITKEELRELAVLTLRAAAGEGGSGDA